MLWQGKQAEAANGLASNQSTLVDNLSEKLGVDKDKVQAVLDDTRKEHQEARRVEVSANLDQAVKDGVITADQKQKFLDHQAQMQGQRQKNRGENQQWAKDNGIDMSKLRDYLGNDGGRHKGGCMNN